MVGCMQHFHTYILSFGLGQFGWRWLSIKHIKTPKSLCWMERITEPTSLDHWTTTPLEHRSQSGAKKYAYLFKAGKQQVDSCGLSAIRYWGHRSSPIENCKSSHSYSSQYFCMLTISWFSYNLLVLISSLFWCLGLSLDEQILGEAGGNEEGGEKEK